MGQLRESDAVDALRLPFYSSMYHRFTWLGQSQLSGKYKGTNELAIHGWDIRSRLAAVSPLSAELLPLLVEMLQLQFRNPRQAGFLVNEGERELASQLE